jgi:hypothetical protein
LKKLHFDLDLQSVIIEHRRERVDPDVVGNFVIGLRLAKERLTKAIQNVGTAQVYVTLPRGPAGLGEDFRDLLRVSFMLPAPAASEAGPAYVDALKRIRSCLLQIHGAACGDVLEIQELEEGLPGWVKGYVPSTTIESLARLVRTRGHDFDSAEPLVAPLQLELDQRPKAIAWYWIHEASHKFALTDDVGAGDDKAYFDGEDRVAHWKGLRAVATNLEALDRTPPAGAMPAALQQRLASVPFEAAVEARFQTFVRQDRFLRVIHAVRSSDLLDNADSYSHFVMFQPDSSS